MHFIQYCTDIYVLAPLTDILGKLFISQSNTKSTIKLEVFAMQVSILWFRHGLRLHDNPALHAALKKKQPFLPIFIFDGETAGTQLIGYNRMRFLCEALYDLDRQLKQLGGRLYYAKGAVVQIFTKIWQELGIGRLCFEEDCEPIWRARDDSVKIMCKDLGIECVECVSHTLWDPKKIIETNGGQPPLTYQMFLYTVDILGDPPRPKDEPRWSRVKFSNPFPLLEKVLYSFQTLPNPEDFGVFPEITETPLVRWIGGETQALKKLEERLKLEERAFRQGYYLPSQNTPDLLGPPASQSAALRHGCLSVRKFYWSIQDLFKVIHGDRLPTVHSITGQLIWREYFYTMSVKNPNYAVMKENPICLDINWIQSTSTDYNIRLTSWKEGLTGYPFIDAIMRQLKAEGWIHHMARNMVACFLTRGDLWISWEEGLQHFLKYLIDADWSVCAGNWMWVSSSAFEQLLDCSTCICPINFGKHFDPSGEFIKRYVPELKKFPSTLIYEPWKASLEQQIAAECIVGKDYPNRIINHKEAAERNRLAMKTLREDLTKPPTHCCPSNENEVRQFMWLQDTCLKHQYVSI
ncbi:cryptochrome-1 [Agrilus planipennis]|uniref:Cryptochrome-1 n=1 Tax=Agrilus planipennis TaxID=224129 RepID=A0A7F5RM93_AGRPL|nr:cryptochrome-1 [Agrilus planipennis]